MGISTSRLARRILLVVHRRAAAGTAVAAVGSLIALTGAITGEANGTQAARPVPSGFAANSITWASPLQGWVLGTAPCGTQTCSDVIGTTDGAKTWQLVGAVNAPIAQIGDPTKPGITQIRFANPQVGWAFRPGLFHTTNGGRSWSSMPIPGGGKQVFDLATNGADAYAVVSTCKWMTGLCNGRQLSLWRTATATGSSWTRIPLDLPAYVSAGVSLFGTSVYVVDPQLGAPDKFYASTDGRSFSSRPVPCDKTPDIQLVQAAPTSATDVALLCVGNPGFSKADKFVFRSTDGGKTDTYAGTMNPYGYQSELAVSASGNLAVASSSDGSFIYINDGHETVWTTQLAMSDGGRGWNDIAYVTNRDAWVVYSPVDFFNGVGKLAVSHDAGHTWNLAPTP